MKQPEYPLKADEDLLTYRFYSEGINGRILKVILLTKGNVKDFYNLCLADLNEETGEISDIAVSDNKDTYKILSTVISALYVFTERNPNAIIFATGSTDSRTRLYRIAITRFLEEARNEFHIYGVVGDEWSSFEPNVKYEGFAVKRKGII